MEFLANVFIVSMIVSLICLLFSYIELNKCEKNIKDVPNKTSYKSTNSKLNNMYNKSCENIENVYKESLSVINSYKFTKEYDDYE